MHTRSTRTYNTFLYTHTYTATHHICVELHKHTCTYRNTFTYTKKNIYIYIFKQRHTDTFDTHILAQRHTDQFYIHMLAHVESGDR